MKREETRGLPYDLSGLRFGKLEVIKIAGKRGRKNLWLCKCDCGNTHKVIATVLTSGRSNSCGCGRGLKKHGLSNTPEYRVYMAIKMRCKNEKNPEYKNYGGRGITICKRWDDSFENFIEDMGRRPSKNHSIDRIDVNGCYEPGNCRWATLKEQNSNKRQTIWVTAFGETLCLTDMAKKHGIKPQTLKDRLKRMPPEAALTKKVVYARRSTKASSEESNCDAENGVEKE